MAAATDKDRDAARGRVPLSDDTFSVKTAELIALERVTSWGVRIEYIDLSLKQIVYVEYVPAAQTCVLAGSVVFVPR